MATRRTQPIDVSEISWRFPKKKGVYLIRNKQTRRYLYVGRTGRSLAGRAVASVAEQKFPWLLRRFKLLEITHRRAEPQTDYEAYQLECRYYHKYNPPKNDKHPACLPGMKPDCPDPKCKYHRRRRVTR